jgi:hypothetical protein
MRVSTRRGSGRTWIILWKIGAKVYFYRPPSVLNVVKKTRKAKHIDHYVGPVVIVKKI